MFYSTEVRVFVFLELGWTEEADWTFFGLFVDLLKYTPASSPSRALVERALEGAMKIAQKCDHAQGNTAFLRI